MTKVIAIKTRLDRSKIKGLEAGDSIFISGGGSGSGSGGPTHPALTLDTSTNGLFLNEVEQKLGLKLASEFEAGAMSASDRLLLKNMSTVEVFKIKNLDIDTGHSIKIGDSIIIEPGSNVNVLRTDNKFTISATVPDVSLVNVVGGSGIEVTGTTTKSVAVRHDTSTLKFIPDGGNMLLSVDTTKMALKSDLHNPVTLGASTNGLSLSGQQLQLALATTSLGGAMSASDKLLLGNLATGELFKVKNLEIDTGHSIKLGDSIIIEPGSNVNVLRTDNKFTISASASDSSLLNVVGGSGIEVTGTTTKSVAVRHDTSTLKFIPDGGNMLLSVDTTKMALKSDLHNPVTIGSGTGNGLSLNNQVLSLATVTTTTEGAMQPTDKVKLNGIEANAINQTTGDGRYLQKSNNLNDLGNVATARDNLGLGSMATKAEGTGTTQFRNNSQNDGRFSFQGHTHPNIVPTSLFPVPQFIAGTYYPNAMHTHNAQFTQSALTANTMTISPFIIIADDNLHIDEIGLNVTTQASTAGSARIYIFDSSAGLPNNVLATYTVSGLNSTGYKSSAANFSFNKSTLYWVGIQTEVAATFRGLTVASCINLGFSAGSVTAATVSVVRTVSYGTTLTNWVWNNAERNTGTAVALMFRATTAPVTIPNTPTNLSVFGSTSNNVTTVTASWSASAGATSYLVQHRNSYDMAVTEEVTSTEWSKEFYFGESNFEVRVAAKNSAGNSDYSSWVTAIMQ